MPGADHSLERPGDLKGTLDVLAGVLSRIEAHLGELASPRGSGKPHSRPERP
ncbi:hypothetical protein [Pseudonocardia zijingensis]|uniref:hypothetical protein n=1 Tax=Pseudonocardia zijingensis TaxID=153376 RepID=UPI0031E1FA97